METPGNRIWTYCLRAYYLSTPAFYLLDRFFDINLRASYFDHKPILNITYYGFSFGCGILACIFKRATILIGLFESVVNIAMLCVGFMLVYVATIEGAMNDSPDLQQHINTLQSTGNFMISAVVLCFSFYFNPLMRRGPSALTGQGPGDS